MGAISIQDAAQYAVNAGFTGASLVTIVASAICESGLDPKSINSTTSGLGTDQGLVKINTYFHPEVTTACALDPQCSMVEAWRISKNGQDFHEWVTFTNGCAGRNFADVTKAIRGVTFNKQNPNDLSQNIGANSPAPGSVTADAINGVIAGATANVFAPLLSAMQSWGLHIGIFLLGLLLVIVGFWLLAGPPPVGDVQNLLKGGKK